MLKGQMGKAFMMIILLAGISCLLSSAQAQTSAWRMVEGGRARIAFAPSHSGKQNAPGYGVIELDLKPGWKTYWSNPGNSGMAPEITMDQAIKADILFPAPQLVKSGEDWAFGYEGHVLLPFSLTPSQPQASSKISGVLLIGLCNTLCVPEKIPFQFQADTNADLMTKGRIAAILSELPKPAQDNFRVQTLTAANDSLHVLLRHPESAAAPQLFMDGDNMQLGVAGIENHKSGETLYTVPVITGKASSGQEVRYIAVLDDQAVTGKAAIVQSADMKVD